MSNFGHSRERQLVKLLEAEDHFAMRAPGSLGAFDVLDIFEGVTRFIECKATAAGPYAGFLPADRKRLIEVADKAGVVPLLCWWPKRAKPKFIGREDWPS